MMVNAIHDDGSSMSGRTEDACRHTLARKLKSTTSAAPPPPPSPSSPSTHLAQSVNRQRFRWSFSHRSSGPTNNTRTAVWSPTCLLTLLLLLLLCFSQDVGAADARYKNDVDVLPASRIQGRGRRRESTLAGPHVPLQLVNVARRQEDDDSSSATTTATRAGATTTQRPILAATGTGARGAPSSSSAAATSTSRPPLQGAPPDIGVPTSTGLPKPFDSSVGNNFTNPACRTFLENMLQDQGFRACEPLSLLLETSRGFFDAAKSLVRITQVLDGTCNVDFDNCRAVMDQFAVELDTDGNCATDLQRRQPNVFQAYHGLLSYAPLYNAGCSKDDDGDYCFANAILDGDDPGDNSIFYLPLGLGIPGGDRPKCKNCTKNIMATYANVASNGTLLISQTYPQAAQQINLGCGPGFVEANVEVEGSASGFARRLSPESRALAFLLATTAASLLLS